MFSIILVIFAIFRITSSYPQENIFSNFFAKANGTIDPRIIGGKEASPHQFPYQVGLYCETISGTSFCGGTLVSKNYILTAAHCLERALSVDIVLGAHEITEEENSQIRLKSSQFIIHDGWNINTLVNDIGLVKLKNSVEENDYVKVIKIAKGGNTYDGQQGTVSGWGIVTDTQNVIAPVLRYVIAEILTNDDCKAIDPFSKVIQPTHLCVSGLSNNINVGSCNGDFGGPLVIDGVQVGIAAFGYKFCEEGKPSVFTRLTEYQNWIADHSDVDL